MKIQRRPLVVMVKFDVFVLPRNKIIDEIEICFQPVRILLTASQARSNARCDANEVDFIYLFADRNSSM